MKPSNLTVSKSSYISDMTQARTTKRSRQYPKWEKKVKSKVVMWLIISSKQKHLLHL